MTRSIAGELQQLREQGLYRSLRTVAGSQGSRVVAEGREVVLLCSNNYLGLADHPSLKRAAVEAVERYGTGSGASRLVSGTMELHAALEERLARFKGTEAALVFNSGYAANSGIIPALVGRGDVVFSDRLNHASIVDGCLLSRARFVRYPHNDMNALERLLAEHRGAGRMLIVTDGVFSMDGDLAPLPALVALKRQYGALLMVDDAHGTGVLGESGRGSAEQFEVAADIDLQMGTLGKALGGFGAYVAASAEVVELLINRARSFIFSTSLPPAVLAAARAALDLVDSPEGKALRRRLARSAALFRDALQEAGFDTMGSETQIVPALVGEAEPAMTFTRRLLEEGFYVQGIRPPTVPAGTCRLRCTLMATHDESDLERAVAAMARIGKELGIV
ncbi:8-amino-7-oxononanoate synthase [Geobacter sulfurreducens]|uniref:8-amino-7-oxononanoate synthase n=1 Tax=Geobacter sulfurreducens (strain ATCC 51573 / DSM 12127 / PCA) TaxID=243231 RepID=BIOF_GEOSL|nr:8-amino-7-oxononanoate synthase [Geobacter sulfurreducens]Q749W3.1 RecName: Full=8-amino-7-oxononanoate synthase; Short=AONS; AltName: Full=7-keto-8-amino-pelargonic acid synthase; Short=7-KAP synthase; Short=KAPA synthase; AltName: Full=8-amino-7-ketopelargonate synthase [Geobacter sulfurreducens PCA]AAR36001.1 8-amino-7-oxononanoate synthase [Geobacter sulfurreducens PCA]UAC03326.1 8-amino-7-oxononanoate synthase [Geobacter sulfurreducens]HCD95835.1 8-amino-7-oxononanoate synthase [Geobact